MDLYPTQSNYSNEVSWNSRCIMYAGPHSNYFKEDYLILFHCLLEDRIFVSVLHTLLLIEVIKHQLQGQKNKRAAQLYTWIRKTPAGFLLYSVYFNDIQTPLRQKHQSLSARNFTVYLFWNQNEDKSPNSLSSNGRESLKRQAWSPLWPQHMLHGGSWVWLVPHSVPPSLLLSFLVQLFYIWIAP